MKGKVIMTNVLLCFFKTNANGVRNHDVDRFTSLLNSFRELICYISPHKHKFGERNCVIPKEFRCMLNWNNPKRHGHRVPDISQEVLLSLVDGVQAQFNQSYVGRPNMETLRDLISKVMASCVKYSDHLTANKTLQFACRSNEHEPIFNKTILELPYDKESLGKFTVQREKDLMERIVGELELKDFYEPVSVDYYFTERRSYQYLFFKNLKSFGVPVTETVLFAQHYGGSKGNKYFVWKEDTSMSEHLTERQKTIDEMVRMLPKYFSHDHKQKSEDLMFDKISPSQFRYIYEEITGDEAISENSKQKEYDKRVRLILKC